MDFQEFFCEKEEDTIELGRSFAKKLKGTEVICLIGDLGAGKTTFVKGLAQGLGIEEGYQVRSPTFTIVNEYPTKNCRLIHVDLYRVDQFDLESFLGEGVIVVEWARDLSLCDYVLEFSFKENGRKVIIKKC